MEAVGWHHGVTSPHPGEPLADIGARQQSLEPKVWHQTRPPVSRPGIRAALESRFRLGWHTVTGPVLRGGAPCGRR